MPILGWLWFTRPCAAGAATGYKNSGAEGALFVPVCLPLLRMIAATAVLGSIADASALAQGKVDAQYTAYLAGLPIGKGSWVIDIGDAHFSASVDGRTTGLVRVVTGGQGTTVAQGSVSGGQPLASTYVANIKTSHKSDDVRLTLANGTAKDVQVDPPIDNDPARVPITDAMRQGVTDPMTASLIYVPGTGNMLVPESCQHAAPVFDGRMRYDLRMAYKRMETVKADKGYAGPALVCSVYFKPVGGHIPTRAAVKYLTETRDVEVWLVPVAGTRILVPFRIQAPTPVGLAMIEANQFVSIAQPVQPPKPAAKNVKTQ
jgi:hypothetical protein